jgi:hypothetical protein
MSLAGFMEAKCFAASKPMPVFAPVTTTVLPDRSTLGTSDSAVWGTDMIKISQITFSSSAFIYDTLGTGWHTVKEERVRIAENHASAPDDVFWFMILD